MFNGHSLIDDMIVHWLFFLQGWPVIFFFSKANLCHFHLKQNVEYRSA